LRYGRGKVFFSQVHDDWWWNCFQMNGNVYPSCWRYACRTSQPPVLNPQDQHTVSKTFSMQPMASAYATGLKEERLTFRFCQPYCNEW
jgi:hypothetical protein